MTTADAVLAGLVLLAAFVQGVTGFGFGLVVMAVLPRFLTLPASVASVVVIGGFVNLFLLARYRRAFDWRAALPLIVAGAVGVPLGVWGLRNLDALLCKRVLGALLVAYAAWGLLDAGRHGPKAGQPVIRRGWAWPAGLLAGLLGGAFATGGPPVIVYASARRWSPARFRAVLQAFFLWLTLLQAPLLAHAGILDGSLAVHALLFVPLVPLGTWVGARFGDRLRPEAFRRVVLAALLVLGASYLLASATL